MITLQCQYCGSEFSIPSRFATGAGRLHYRARHSKLKRAERKHIRLVLV